MAGPWLYLISERAGRSFDLADGQSIPVSVDSYRALLDNGRIAEDRYWSVTQNWKNVQIGDELLIYTGDFDLGIIGYATVDGVEHRGDGWCIVPRFHLERSRALLANPVPATVIREWIAVLRKSVVNLAPFEARIRARLPWANHAVKAVALKVAYNDGGARPGGLIGYRGVCSNPVILDNVKIRRMPNCKEVGGPCRLFADKNFTGPRPSLQIRQPWCYESTLLSHKPWKFGAGVYHRGRKKGKPIPIRNASVGDIAILTTREPGAREGDRFIFAIFRVGEISSDPVSGAMITSDGTLDISLPDDVARVMSFWRYHHAKEGPDWRTGLFRYLAADETTVLLTELMGALGDCSERDSIYEAMGQRLLPRSPGTNNHTNPTCPEGLAHRLLKERVAANPNLIGLPKSAKPDIEHSFLSGDRVDIQFSLLDGSAAVVEIETIIPLPGAHQCIKYRSLHEAERGEDLNSGNVQAILVAYAFDTETQEFAKKYNVKLVELPP